MNKIVEVIDGVVTVSNITYWDSVEDIPEDIPKIYFEAPEYVESGWLFDGINFSEPAEIPVQSKEMSISEATNLMLAVQFFGLELSIDQTAEAASTIAKTANVPPIPDGNEWKAGLNLVEGTRVVYMDSNFEVIQAHISQSDWTPPNTPSLFKAIKTEYVEWSQPSGAHDAYMKGDKVIFNDDKWISDMDGNVWRPGDYGWTME